MRVSLLLHTIVTILLSLRMWPPLCLICAIWTCAELQHVFEVVRFQLVFNIWLRLCIDSLIRLSSVTIATAADYHHITVIELDACQMTRWQSIQVYLVFVQDMDSKQIIQPQQNKARFLYKNQVYTSRWTSHACIGMVLRSCTNTKFSIKMTFRTREMLPLAEPLRLQGMIFQPCIR